MLSQQNNQLLQQNNQLMQHLMQSHHMPPGVYPLPLIQHSYHGPNPSNVVGHQQLQYNQFFQLAHQQRQALNLMEYNRKRMIEYEAEERRKMRVLETREAKKKVKSAKTKKKVKSANIDNSLIKAITESRPRASIPLEQNKLLEVDRSVWEQEKIAMEAEERDKKAIEAEESRKKRIEEEKKAKQLKLDAELKAKREKAEKEEEMERARSKREAELYANSISTDDSESEAESTYEDR